jgi:pre-rRNA-processing protein TSR4
MESNAEKLRGLTITSLDEEDDEPELPHRSPPASGGGGGGGAGYEDDDEEEEEEAEVTLGFLEKPKHPGLLLRHLFPSKAGGIPVRTDCTRF